MTEILNSIRNTLSALRYPLRGKSRKKGGFYVDCNAAIAYKAHSSGFAFVYAELDKINRNGKGEIYIGGYIMFRRKLVIALGIIVLAAGCGTPRIQTADPQVLLRSELAFIQDGVTTREQAVLKLGVPSAQLEGDRIMMYQLLADKDGKWHLVAPRSNSGTGLRQCEQGTCSLVLVFGADGILRKHSLVTSKVTTQ
jgi:hypothetical protein